jgi:hypothetical protein
MFGQLTRHKGQWQVRNWLYDASCSDKLMMRLETLVRSATTTAVINPSLLRDGIPKPSVKNDMMDRLDLFILFYIV